VAYFSSALHIAPFTTDVYVFAHGVQQVGTSLTFSLEQAFELGQIAIYENVENIPNVELTAEKVLDGHPPLWCLSTSTATTPTLPGRSNERCNLQFGIYEDTVTVATGQGTIRRMMASGMYPSSLGWTFGVDGNFTESITWVGNDLWWTNSFAGGPSTFAALDVTFSGGDIPRSANGSGGINRRENFLYSPVLTGGNMLGADVNGRLRDPNTSILPLEIPGITSSGLNPNDSNGFPLARVQSIAINCDLGREEILELGARGPYYRYLTFPTEVTTAIDVLSTSGVGVSATQLGIYVTGVGGLCTDRYNLVNHTIRVAVCEGTRIYLGTQNKLSSVNEQGGDTGGGNRTFTLNYSTFNDLTVGHINDTNALLRPTGATANTYWAPLAGT
jgi:hypothetical protein